MSSPTFPLVDLGNTFALAILAAVEESLTLNELTMPARLGIVGGTSIPTADACEGMLWVRLGTQLPTYGDGTQFAETRAGFDIPSWLYAFEVGILWCHGVIEEGGESPDAAEWQSNALRDGQYRMAVLYGLSQLLPPAIKGCAGGFSIDPWAPIGPDGGYSGGITIVRIATSFLAQ